MMELALPLRAQRSYAWTSGEVQNEKLISARDLGRARGRVALPGDRRLDTPIYQSTTFVSANSDEMAAVYGEKKPGYMYTRYGNPTIRALEEKIAALEGGEAALATSTGMAAISSAILGYVKAGDHVVGARSLYGGAYNF